MKINTTLISQSGGATTNKDTGQITKNDSAAQTSGSSDSASRLTLSATARMISRPSSESNTHPEFDSTRINWIKQEISAGTYRTDPARIAEKFHQLNMSLQ